MKKIFTLIATALVAVSANAQVQAVDLGLSVKWGDRYVGAKAIEAVGEYYAFGETSPKSSYSMDNWAYKNESYVETMAFECAFNTTDVTVKDAATVNCGEGWRMPTKAELQELLDKCKITVAKAAEMAVGTQTLMKITGPNNNSINILTAGKATKDGYNNMTSHDAYLISSTLQEIETWGDHYAPLYLQIMTTPKTSDYPNGAIDDDPSFDNSESCFSGYCILPVFSDKASIKDVTDDAQTSARKYVKDGKLVIEKDGKEYNAVGARLAKQGASQR